MLMLTLIKGFGFWGAGLKSVPIYCLLNLIFSDRLSVLNIGIFLHFYLELKRGFFKFEELKKLCGNVHEVR